MRCRSGWACRPQSEFRVCLPAAAAFCALASAPAGAIDFSFGELTGSLRAQVALGAALRTEKQDPDLIGKLNLPGQEQFCEDKSPAPGRPAPGINCSNVDGNAQWLALPGAASVNNDNGDLNYARGKLINAAVKFAPRLELTYGDFGLNVSGLFFYDAANYHLEEFHPNNLGDNNGFQPRHTRRPRAAEKQIGLSQRLLDANVSGVLPLPGERQLSFKLGNQVLSYGTSTLLVFNSLNTVNPPDANVRFLPGSEPRDLFVRVPLAVLGTNLNEALSVQGFYQFGWKPVALPPIGSYYSANDVLGAGDPYAMLLFGKYREDPQNLMGAQGRTQGNVYLISSAGRTLYLAPQVRPSHQGEYGFNLSYFAASLNSTTFALTYLNLHSRLPLVGFIASKQGCAHDATNQADLLVACRGFNGPTHLGEEPLPLDTVKLYLEYPENIHALGASFSSNLGPVSWTGEVVFRPNQPLQIDAVDIGFAALQPIFPAGNIVYGTGAPGLPSLIIPSRRTATPDYVETVYRRETVQPGQAIRGYERLKTLAYDMSFLFLGGASDNPFHADQMTALLELGAFQVLDLPGLDRLQFAAPGTQFHHSAGVDSTGTPTSQQAATDPSARLNPQYQASGFATAFSWGYRLLGQLTYEEALPGLRLLPQLAWFHDISGKSPLPTGEFVAGRKQAMLGLAAVFRDSWSGALRYNWYFGGGRSNNLSDRDNVQLTLSYDF